jgi:hypothetical protein
MERVSPELVSAIFIVLAALTTIVCMIINTWNNSKRKPSADVDFAKVETSLQQLIDNQHEFREAIKGKRDEKDCDRIVQTLERDLTVVRDRHGHWEDKISRQIGGVHERINSIFGQLRELTGQFNQHAKEKAS